MVYKKAIIIIFTILMIGVTAGCINHTTTSSQFPASSTSINQTTTSSQSLPSSATTSTSAVKQPPVVSTGTAYGLTSTGAILSGSLTSLGSADSISVSFQYGTTTRYGHSTISQTMTATGPFTINLTGLTSDTTYHYRTVATGDGTVYGSDQTFTTTIGWLSNWVNRIQITVDHTKIKSNLSDFPLLIHLSSSSGINSANVSAVFNTLGNNSQKIAVTTADGTTQCYVEIESWDSSNKQADLWVKVPTISSASNTVLYLYYDNGQENNSTYVGPTGSAAAQKVWDSHFVAVYHLAQQGNGTAGEYKDSTSHGYNGQGEKTGNASFPERTNGISGGYGQLFDGISDYPDGNFIKIPDENGFSQPTTGYLMISFWMNPTTLNFQTYNDAGQDYVRIFGKAESGQGEWHFRLYNSRATVGASCPGAISVYAYNLSGGDGAGAGLNKPGMVTAGNWVYITALFDPTFLTAWLNAPPYTAWGYFGGYTMRTVTYDAMEVEMKNGTADITIGAGSSTNNNGFYSGKFDEIRFSNTARSESWIIASFYSERDRLLSLTMTNNPNLPPT